MIYETYMDKVKSLCLSQDEETGLWYLEPEWKFMLTEAHYGGISGDYVPSIEDIQNVLELEVKKRNIKVEYRKTFIIDWLYDIITTTVEPEILKEQTDLVASTLEYMRFRDSEAQKKTQLPDVLAQMDFNKKAALSH